MSARTDLCGGCRATGIPTATGVHGARSRGTVFSEEALSGVSLADDVRDALLGRAPEGNPLAQVYALVRAYEAAQWETVARAAQELNLSAGSVASLYTQAVGWPDKAFRSGGAGGRLRAKRRQFRAARKRPSGAP